MLEKNIESILFYLLVFNYFIKLFSIKSSRATVNDNSTSHAKVYRLNEERQNARLDIVLKACKTLKKLYQYER